MFYVITIGGELWARCDTKEQANEELMRAMARYPYEMGAVHECHSEADVQQALEEVQEMEQSLKKPGGE